MDYVDDLTAMFDNQNDLLLRLTKDIAEYLQVKGDIYIDYGDAPKAKICYIWAKKLMLRMREPDGQTLDDLDKKIIDARRYRTLNDTTGINKRCPPLFPRTQLKDKQVRGA
ncbi:unnamed protein product, partial [Didymodactylos carnosus]